MHKVLIAGAGKVGSLIATLLTTSGDYEVVIADLDFSGPDITRLLKKEILTNFNTVKLNMQDHNAVTQFLKQNSIEAVISCLPYHVNESVAQIARKCNLHYFDLTEDTSVTKTIKELSEDAATAFVPQCGLAPGFISIAAKGLMKDFDSVESVKLRVGALPQNNSNVLHYALTWSTEGVINQYGNLCHGIENGEFTTLYPLDGLEHIQIDGLTYEAFNTSGGLGSLAELHVGDIKTMNYKTIRYPGHCEKMRVLMNDLKLNEDRDTLKRILENAIPQTYQDVVLIYVSVTGSKKGTYLEENYTKKIYPDTLAGLPWTAIQITTASGVCGVVDLVLNNIEKYQGLVYQENFELGDFLGNRFGKYYI